MQEPIYILGHKNPDADAICSALAYAEYKNLLGETHYIAARCGNSNARIDAILDRFNTKLPIFIGDVTPRLQDIMQRNIKCLNPQSTCTEALELIDQHDVRALPVVNEQRHVIGMISIFQLGEFFIPKPNDPLSMRRVHTSIDSIIQSLSAQVVHSEDSEKIEELYLRVGAMDIHSFGKHHNVAGIAADQSVIIVGDRLDIQERCIELGVRLLVITGELKVSESIIQAAKTKGISLIISPYDSATTSWIIRTATHIERLIDTQVHSFAKTDCVSSVKRRIANLNDSLYTVIDNEKRLVGVFSKSDILRPSKKRIALVDHNELEQAVSGAAEVHITEIIDHHRLGNIPTEQPILFVNQPVGSTCSIVAELFRAKSMAPSKSIAGIMMAGIISDTLLLNSPTTTPLEGELLKWLEPIAEIESGELADLIFTAGSLIVNNTPPKVIHADCKIYDEGVLRYSVSQIEELGFANFWNKEIALKKALDSYNKKEGLLFSLLMISDINTQNSLLIFSGDADIRQGIKFTELGKTGIFELPGIVSRKKQLIPYFSSLLKEQGLL